MRKRSLAESWSMIRFGSGLTVEEFIPAHPSPDAPPGQQGAGRSCGTWIACEEPGREQHWLPSGIELVMDTTLDPHASIGRREHPETEQLYLIQTGELTVTAWQPGSEEVVAVLGPGDVHRLGPGGWHAAKAGPSAARMITIKARVSP